MSQANWPRRDRKGPKVSLNLLNEEPGDISEDNGKQLDPAQSHGVNTNDLQSKLCSECRKINIYTLAETGSGTVPSLSLVYGSKEDFLRSALKCPLCKLMVQEMQLDRYPTIASDTILKIYPVFGVQDRQPISDGQTIRGLQIFGSLRKAFLALSATEGL